MLIVVNYVFYVGRLPWQQDAKTVSQSDRCRLLTQEPSNNESMAITSKCNVNSFKF